MKRNHSMVSCELDEADWHVHPDYSLDAEGSIDQYCQKALELGLKEICFVTHYDSDPFRKDDDPFMRIDGKIVPLSKESVETYLDDVRRAQKKFSPEGLSVKAGLEIDYSPHIEDKLRQDLSFLDLDYLLGAVHCLDHVAISASNEAERYFERKNLEEMVEEYYGSLMHAVESGLFDAMAHLDIYKKYGLRFYGGRILTAHHGLVEPVLKLMAKSDVGMEINTGVLRKGHDEFCPGREILEMVLEAGVSIAAFGSDAHAIEDLGKGIEEAYVMVERLKEQTDRKSKTLTK
ncbi:MAG: histidinol-phosphatase [Candidatus Zixiibacteriota bacterium]